jgi:23S rRNA pseudouridine1911/1915/1917 synthase
VLVSDESPGAVSHLCSVTTDLQFLSITEERSGERVDSYLSSVLENISRTRLQRAIEDGDVLVNLRTVKSSYRLRPGDKIEIDLPEPPQVALVPENIPLRVVYEDADIVVVDKPAGMVVHPGAGVRSRTLANALAFHFSQLSDKAGGLIRPGIVHRLDKETSGLLVVAKNEAAHERLSEQFHDRIVGKVYIALVYGRLARDRGEIDARIGRSPRNRTRMAVLSGGAGRAAQTAFEVTARYSQFTLLRVRMKTGRTHQIRVHLSHVGHPVAGDLVYGTGRENALRDPSVKRALKGLGRHFLHAGKLGFKHPATGERMVFESPLPEELSEFLALLDQSEAGA